MGSSDSVARVGVIGSGWWSTFAHLPALRRNPGASIVGIADPSPGNRAAAAKAFEVSALFDSTAELLDATEPNAVVIAVPPAFHYECAHAALSRGVHVLLEKPMVLNVGDARALVDLADRQGVELLMSYPWQYNRHALALREELAHGAIGKIEHVTCLFASIVRELYRGNPEPYREVLQYVVNAPGASTYSDPSISGGGQGPNQLTHAFALLLFLTGLVPEAVAAFTECFELAVDLADVTSVRFHGGTVGSLSAVGSVLPDQEEILEYRIFGRTGHVMVDFVAGDARIYADGRRRTLPVIGVADRYPHWAPVDNLVEVVLGTGTNRSPGVIGLQTVAFLEAMHRSSASGGSAESVDPA